MTPQGVDVTNAGIRTIVNGEKMQESDLSQLIFSISNIISTISTFTAFQPGDIILTGTPGGVGFRRDPQVFLHPGGTVTVQIDGVGTVSNTLVAQ